MKDVKCLSCRGLLFKANPLDDKGNWAMDPKFKLSLTQEANEAYFKCPHCGAKNVVIDSASPSGLPQIKIVRVKK